MRYAFSVAVALLGIVGSSTAQADFRADFNAVKGTRDHDLTRIELGGQHMRTDAGQVSMLFDVSSGKMLMLQHGKKQYMDMAQVAQAANSGMARARQALANLPPEQRAMIEKRLGNRMPGMLGGNVDVKVTPTGKRERVGKYACAIYRTTVNGRQIQDACLADAGNVGISKADQATLRHAFEQLKELMNKMSAGLARSPLSGMPTGKFPVEITQYDSRGRMKSEVRLQQVSRSAVPASDFRIPTGYTERKMPGSSGR